MDGSGMDCNGGRQGNGVLTGQVEPVRTPARQMGAVCCYLVLEALGTWSRVDGCQIGAFSSRTLFSGEPVDSAAHPLQTDHRGPSADSVQSRQRSIVSLPRKARGLQYGSPLHVAPAKVCSRVE